MEELCEDVLRDILSRLGVKDAVRVKSVCKRWGATVSSQALIDLHHRRSSSTAIRAGLIYGAQYKPGRWCVAEFAGSCDGLVCLRSQGVGLVEIWNPSLNNVSLQLFVTTTTPHDDLELYYWFGRGRRSDYVLLAGTSSHLYVISLGRHGHGRLGLDAGLATFSWAQGKKYRLIPEEVGTLFENVVYWVAEDKVDGGVSVAWYNLGEETTGEMAAPPQSGWHTRLSLGEVDGCLSTLMTLENKFYQLWVMKEADCWTNLMAFAPGVGVDIPTPEERYAHERLVTVDDPATLLSPLFGKHFYVQTLVSPLSLGN